MDALGWLDGEVNLVDWTENFVDLTDGSLSSISLLLVTTNWIAHLVLEVYWGVEVWDLCVDGLANNFTLTSVHE